MIMQGKVLQIWSLRSRDGPRTAYTARSARSFPVEKKLGGAKDLRDLAAYAKEKGVSLYLQANYARAYEKSDGMSKKKDAIRGMDREVKESPNYYVRTAGTITVKCSIG